jgi:hypothetical protein
MRMNAVIESCLLIGLSILCSSQTTYLIWMMVTRLGKIWSHVWSHVLAPHTINLKEFQNLVLKHEWLFIIFIQDNWNSFIAWGFWLEVLRVLLHEYYTIGYFILFYFESLSWKFWKQFIIEFIWFRCWKQPIVQNLPQNTTQTILQVGLQIQFFPGCFAKENFDFEVQTIKKNLMGSKSFLSSSILL